MNGWATGLRVVVCALIFAIGAGPAWGQGTGESAAPKPKVWELVMSGGTVGFLLVVLSCVALFLILEQAVVLGRKRLAPPLLVSELTRHFENRTMKTAEEVCRARDSLLSRVLLAGLAERSKGLEAMERALEDAGRAETSRLLHRVGYLSVIANMAPMMGLLGTVIGMIGAFGQIASAGTPTPDKLAGPIAKALVTTCEGLIVAIPCVAFYYIYDQRVRQGATRCEQVIDELLRLVKGKPKSS